MRHLIQNLNPKFKTALFWLIPIALLAIGFGSGWAYFQWFDNAQNSTGQVQDVRAGQDKFTNPLLECNESQNEFVEPKPFKTNIQSLVSQQEQEGTVTAIDLFFEDLNNGPWFGINSSATFSPASLLKVPLAIAYYKLAEQESSQPLTKTIVYKGQQSTWPPITQTIKPQQTLTVGQSYSYEELIRRMLEYSDNTAYYLLFDNINYDDLIRVYSDFGLKINGPGTADDSVVTVQGYSNFFRILFNASYLNQDDSDQLLSFLSQSEYTSGLVAGVPLNTLVSHKFGERESTGSNLEQLSDCGIIYYPLHPYLLCISTTGADLNSQSGAISKISQAVYDEVDNQYSGN